MDLFGNKEIRALSWKEPYASLMLYEKIETRTWATKYRGLVLICASKKPYKTDEINEISGCVQQERVMDIIFDNNNLGTKNFIDFGKAIAIGELVDCRPMTKGDENKCFVEYSPDLWCHVYKNVLPIDSFPFKGVQGWKKLNNDIWDQIKFINVIETGNLKVKE